MNAMLPSCQAHFAKNMLSSFCKLESFSKTAIDFFSFQIFLKASSLFSLGAVSYSMSITNRRGGMRINRLGFRKKNTLSVIEGVHYSDFRFDEEWCSPCILEKVMLWPPKPYYNAFQTRKIQKMENGNMG